jgi:hypothetical protein
MKKIIKTPNQIIMTIMVFAMLFVQMDISAQNHQKSHSAPQKKSAPQRSATQKSVSRPSGSSHSSTAKRPATTSSNNKPVSRPSTSSSSNKPVAKRPSTSSNNKKSSSVSNDRNIASKKNVGNNNKVGNTNNIGSNNKNVKNNNVNINVDNSKDIKINNSHNTSVRRNNNIHYGRAPYHYGGYGYNCYHPYYPRPYHGYNWGPVWHPWGFFIATIAVTAIIVNVANQPEPYHYDNGTWYQAGNGGYTAVAAPVGGTVVNIPEGAETVNTGTVNNYYYGNTYYEKSDGGYTVVAPTAGTIVDKLPEGGEEVTLGDVKYVKFGETYYQPVQVDGKDKYEIALVEKV